MEEGLILAAHYPELTEEWNYDKNGALTPWMVTTGSSKRVWWVCSLGHEWATTVQNRTGNYTGCPYCKGKKAWPGFNDLATLQPDLATEWDHESNGPLTPQMVTVGSSKKVWWVCSLGHKWKATISTRSRYHSGCPYCVGKKAWPGFNDLATLRPDLAAEWDYDKNGEKLPTGYTVHSGFKVWWICPKGHPPYYMQIAKKANGEKCPRCMREKVAAKQSKMVLQYSLDGELLCTYPSVAAAGKAFNGKETSVSAACRGEHKTSMGYVFRYADNDQNEMLP